MREPSQQTTDLIMGVISQMPLGYLRAMTKREFDLETDRVVEVIQAFDKFSVEQGFTLGEILSACEGLLTCGWTEMLLAVVEEDEDIGPKTPSVGEARAKKS